MNLRNAFIEKMYTYVNCTGTFDLVSPTSTCETYGLCDLVTITIANQQRCHLSHSGYALTVFTVGLRQPSFFVIEYSIEIFIEYSTTPEVDNK